MKAYINKIATIGIVFLVIIACQKDDAIPQYNFSDALATSGDKRIQRDDFASFADLSKGVISRTWTIPQSASIINLEGRDPSEMDLIQVLNLYSLTANIGDNFDEEHEMNSESIFEVAFSTEFSQGTSGSAADGPLGSEATSRARTLAPDEGGGYRTIMPSYYMTMLFKKDTMDITNPINSNRTGAANYSIRTSMSIAIADDDNTTIYQIPSDSLRYNNNEASYLKKFQNWTLLRESDQSISGINERVIRLADVMLLYAECLLQTGGAYTEALDLINEIRYRAGVVLLEPADYDNSSTMEHIMWTERPLELMFEGHDTRWEDLTRWDKVQEQYDRLALKSYVLVSKNLYEFDPAIHNEDKKLIEFESAATSYQSAIHNYFPIPSTEQNSNPGLFN